jgi:hypothetical protein
VALVSVTQEAQRASSGLPKQRDNANRLALR